MYKINHFFIVLIILVVLLYFYNLKYKYTLSNKINEENSKENFKVNSQNWVYNNVNDVADSLSYGNNDSIGIYKYNSPNPMGPSDKIGVGNNSKQDVYDNRGFNWTKNASDPQVDVFTEAVDDTQLRNKFERTYMLDPDGSVAQYDITYNKISPACCPAQYSPPFKVDDKNSSNCDTAQKYVANQYSGMNYNNGYGCVCMTPKQADFYGTRGGNTD